MLISSICKKRMYFINDWNVMSHRNNDKTFLFAAMTKYFISCFVQIFWFHVHIFYHILATATAAAEKPHLINLVIQRMFYVRPSIVKVTFSFFPRLILSPSFLLKLPWEIFLKCKGAKNLLKSQKRRIFRNLKHVTTQGCTLLYCWRWI